MASNAQRAAVHRSRERLRKRRERQSRALNEGTQKAAELLGIEPSDAADVHEDLMPRLQALARRYTVSAFGRVLHEMEHGESSAVRLAAAAEVLNRGWGRAPQVVDVTHRRELAPEELQKRLAAVLAEIGKKARAMPAAIEGAAREVVNESPAPQVVESPQVEPIKPA